MKAADKARRRNNAGFLLPELALGFLCLLLALLALRSFSMSLRLLAAGQWLRRGMEGAQLELFGAQSLREDLTDSAVIFTRQASEIKGVLLQEVSWQDASGRRGNLFLFQKEQQTGD